MLKELDTDSLGAALGRNHKVIEFALYNKGSLKYFMGKDRGNRLRRGCLIFSNTPQPKPDNRQRAKVRLCVNIGFSL